MSNTSTGNTGGETSSVKPSDLGLQMDTLFDAIALVKTAESRIKWLHAQREPLDGDETLTVTRVISRGRRVALTVEDAPDEVADALAILAAVESRIDRLSGPGAVVTEDESITLCRTLRCAQSLLEAGALEISRELDALRGIDSRSTLQ
jgi:hypothetical protein